MEQTAWGATACVASDLTRQMVDEDRIASLLQQAHILCNLAQRQSDDPTARQLISVALATASLAALLRGHPPAVYHTAPPPPNLPPANISAVSALGGPTLAPTMQKLQQRLDCLTRELSLGNPASPDGALSPPTSRLGESYCVLPSSALPRTAPAQLAVLVHEDPPSLLERDILEAIAAEHRSVLAEVAAARREGHAVLALVSASAERHEKEMGTLLDRQRQLERVVAALLVQTARK